MKAEELMIGDWVLTLDSTHKEKVFAQVDAIEEGKHSILVTRECSNWFVDIDWIEPISLTTEILEKNGLKNGKLNVSPQYYLEDNGVFIGVTLKDIPDKHKGIDIAKGRLCLQLDVSRMEEPLYVHQLQHALRLCGIEKEIVL